jgi:hypothetical protein
VVEARSLYVDEPLGLEELDQRNRTVYTLDATTIDLCLSVFPWARFRTTKGGVKMHTLLDLRGRIPAFTWITDTKFGDVRILDLDLDSLVTEPGSIYVFDRAFIDFPRLRRLDEAHAIFVTRLKRGVGWKRVYSRRVDQTTGWSAIRPSASQAPPRPSTTRVTCVGSRAATLKRRRSSSS